MDVFVGRTNTQNRLIAVERHEQDKSVSLYLVESETSPLPLGASYTWYANPETWSEVEVRLDNEDIKLIHTHEFLTITRVPYELLAFPKSMRFVGEYREYSSQIYVYWPSQVKGQPYSWVEGQVRHIAPALVALKKAHPEWWTADVLCAEAEEALAMVLEEGGGFSSGEWRG